MTPPEPVGEISRLRQAKRDRLLDAASELLANCDWREISMDRVASEAGVSRQTVYNEFKSRGGFELAFVMREVEQFLDGFEAAIAACEGNATEVLTAGTMRLLGDTRNSNMVKAITRGGADDLLVMFTTRGRPVVTVATQRVAEVLRNRWPWLDHPSATGLAETLVRLAISHGALTMDNDANAAQSMARIAGAFIELEGVKSNRTAARRRRTVA